MARGAILGYGNGEGKRLESHEEANDKQACSEPLGVIFLISGCLRWRGGGGGRRLPPPRGCSCCLWSRRTTELAEARTELWGRAPWVNPLIAAGESWRLGSNGLTGNSTVEIRGWLALNRFSWSPEPPFTRALARFSSTYEHVWNVIHQSKREAESVLPGICA